MDGQKNERSSPTRKTEGNRKLISEISLRLNSLGMLLEVTNLRT